MNKQRILELIPGRGARARFDCEKDDTSYDDYVEYYKKKFPMLTPPASAQERVQKAIQDRIDA